MKSHAGCFRKVARLCIGRFTALCARLSVSRSGLQGVTSFPAAPVDADVLWPLLLVPETPVLPTEWPDSKSHAVPLSPVCVRKFRRCHSERLARRPCSTSDSALGSSADEFPKGCSVI